MTGTADKTKVSGAMSDQVTDVTDVDQLIAEISALRGKVAQLQERVEQLDMLAHEDSLVGLPNRRGFVRALERLIDRMERYDEQGAVLFVDLDGLKVINDTFGHQAGDEALIQVSRLLVGGVRKSDLVARIGGDEFAILLGHSNEIRRATQRTDSSMRSPPASSPTAGSRCRLASPSAPRQSMPTIRRKRRSLAPTRKCTAVKLRPRPLLQDSSCARPTNCRQARKRLACRSGSQARRSRRR